MGQGMGNMPGAPGGMEDPSSSSSNSDAGSGSGSGAGALGLAGAGAGAGSLAGSGSGSEAYSGSDSTNLNGNGNLNGNLDGNLNRNLNDNMNTTTTTVDDKVTVDVKATVDDSSGPPSTTDSGNSNSFDSISSNTTYNISVNLTDSPLNLADANNFLAGSGDNFTFNGGGTDTAFHVDQVNGLIANNGLSNVSLTDSSSSAFSQTASDMHGGNSTAGGIDNTVGDSVSSAVSSAASATATLSAFTQNIVLGANIQYNSLSQTATGGSITHTAAATDPVRSEPRVLAFKMVDVHSNGSLAPTVDRYRAAQARSQNGEYTKC